MKTQPWIVWVLILLFATLLLSLACGDDDDDDDNDDDSEDCVCGDGTWTDPTTGLTWQNPPGHWAHELGSIKAYCGFLNDFIQLGGHTDWRLPTIDELRTLVRGCPTTAPGGACKITDGCTDETCLSDHCEQTDCGALGGPGTGGYYWPEGLFDVLSGGYSSSDGYFSSSCFGYDEEVDDSAWCWELDFTTGAITTVYSWNESGDDVRIRCVRGELDS